MISKYSIIAIICIIQSLLMSCQVQHRKALPYISLYMSPQVGEVLPSYLIIKSHPETFEIYMPGIWESTLGEWNLIDDTLYINPQFEYYVRDGKRELRAITKDDSTIVSIPQKYLVKKNMLIDKTDYRQIIPDYLYHSFENVYIKMK